MRAKWTAILGLVAVVAMAMPVLADDNADLASADRALIHSYDPTAMQLLWTTVLDRSADDACTVVEGQDYIYDISENGDVEVVGTEGDCTFHATDVTGPNGQVNHGTVVSAFVKALKESGYEGNRGCMIKLIAGSGYGKDDQQIKTSEVDEIGPIDESAETSAQFTVSETTCGKPDKTGNSKPDRVDKEKPAKSLEKGHGRPDHAAQGKPGN